ncbi:MAG: Gfo/Idh/MocA family oxidoreductase [Sedimentisphaerales bacterium]|nr:Gfo/Idh/MocA family oxidoreductase [Sedimentisphaerales bacterium]
MKQKNKNHDRVSRRTFMGSTIAAAAAFTVVPRHVLGQGRQAPSDKLNIAGVGVGGMGNGNINNCKNENIVALCDVDSKYAGRTFEQFPKARQWKDFRKMLDGQKEIEAVVIATPDHAHAIVALEAMKRGKHVYVQKPLTRTVGEARILTQAARKYKVATQMGNQGHSGDGVRDICEWIWAGVIGEVKEVHAWTNRPVWPQGIKERPPAQPVPDTLDWDLYCGPSPLRPYNEAYHPFKWRGWWDFGAGALGDMACHVLDPVLSALKLKYPMSVWACATEVNDETFPLASVIRFEFPEREEMPAVKVNWYDGGMKPPRPDELDDRRDINQASSNVLFMGTKGVLRCGEYGDNPQLLPYSRMRDFVNNKPPQTLERIKTSHEGNWIQACKGGKPATSNFDYSGPFTEMVVMGNLALKRLGKKLLWDGENMKFTNDDEANKYVLLPARKGWELKL